MRTYHLRIRFDGTLEKKPGLTWTRSRSGGGYCLETPGQLFSVLSTKNLENKYLTDLQVGVFPTWDDLEQMPPPVLTPTSGNDTHDAILLLIQSDITDLNLGKLIQRPFADLIETDKNTVYGEAESDICLLLYLEFGITRTFSVNGKKITLKVEQETGKLTVV